jgi:hypothetical protein
VKRLFILLFLLVASPAFSVTEDFTTFTETDSASDITINSATQITVSSMARTANSSVAKDYGAGYFGNFEHRIQTNHTSSDVSAGWVNTVWTLGNVANPTMQDLADDGAGLLVYWGAGPKLWLQEDHGTITSDSSTTLSDGTEYYLTIKRTDSAITCTIYSDADRTTTVDTLSINHVSNTYRYLGVATSRDASGTDANSYVVSNLDIGKTNYCEDSNTIGCWVFNTSGTVIDSSGNGNDGTNNGATFTTGASCDVGNCYTFATDDYIDLTDLGTFGSGIDTGSTTFYFSFHTTSTSQESLIGTFNDGTNTGIQINLNTNSSDSADQDKVGIFLRDSAGTPNTNQAGSTADLTNLTDGNHHTLMIVFDEGSPDSWTLYYDGTSQGLSYFQQDSLTTTQDFGYNLTLGARNVRGTIGRYFNGVINEAAIFSRNFGSSDALDLHNNGLGVPASSRNRMIIIQ